MTALAASDLRDGFADISRWSYGSPYRSRSGESCPHD
jgi:hypothetical protein